MSFPQAGRKGSADEEVDLERASSTSIFHVFKDLMGLRHEFPEQILSDSSPGGAGKGKGKENLAKRKTSAEVPVRRCSHTHSIHKPPARGFLFWLHRKEPTQPQAAASTQAVVLLSLSVFPTLLVMHIMKATYMHLQESKV